MTKMDASRRFSLVSCRHSQYFKGQEFFWKKRWSVCVYDCQTFLSLLNWEPLSFSSLFEDYSSNMFGEKNAAK